MCGRRVRRRRRRCHGSKYEYECTTYLTMTARWGERSVETTCVCPCRRCSMGNFTIGRSESAFAFPLSTAPTCAALTSLAIFLVVSYYVSARRKRERRTKRRGPGACAPRPLVASPRWGRVVWLPLLLPRRDRVTAWRWGFVCVLYIAWCGLPPGFVCVFIHRKNVKGNKILVSFAFYT